MNAQRAELAIRAVRVSWADVERTLLEENASQLPRAQKHALDILDRLATRIEPEANAELMRLLTETRRRIVHHA